MNTINKNVSRRNFVRITGMSGAALTVGLYLPASAKNKAEIITGEDAVNLNVEMNAWISIDKAGKVTLMNHRSEMGQGAYQVVPQMIAEELEVNLDNVNIQFAPGNNKKYGSQITGGSSTVRGSYKNLLRMGATAREMLIATAAKKWNVANTECYAENASVIHKPTGNKFGYGELAEEAAKLEAPKNVQLKKREAYKIIGKPLQRQDTPSKVNGKAIFGIDKKLDGMMYAVVERCPRIVGKVKSFDDSATKAVPGVKHVFKIQRAVFDSLLEGVAVVADNLWAAMQGRKALKVDWDDDGFEHLSTAQLYERMKADLSKDHLNDRSAGNFQMVFDKATKKVEAVYETPYESHSCMEPLNCVAHVHDNKCEIWGPIQGPDWIQADISTRLGIPIENVTVNMTFLGGGFGRKAFTDYPHEAVVISKEIKAPVQVVWTREDDMTQGPFRPGAVYGCKGVIDGDRIAAMQTKMATQNMDQQGPNADRSKYNSSTIEGLLKPYLEAIPDYSFGDVPTTSPIPVMWWRSVYASTNGFAYESFIDELAIAAEKDPLAFRRAHLESNPRYATLVDKLSEVTNWETRGKNEGWGVAITECFDSIVGEVVKVSKKASGGVKIDKVIAVMDCGWYVNPDIIKAQVEGSIMMALGAATVHETTFENGKAVEKNFDRYRMPRFTDAPEIEVHIVDNDERAGGVGEPGLPPFSPALTNAIFDLTGKRIRKLPFSLDEV